MQRARYTAGVTTLSRVKSLVLFLQGTHGQPAANELLQRLELSEDDLRNETYPVAMDVWYAAVELFATRYGRDAIPETWPGIIHDENLAVWMRVVRGTTHPIDAFRQLDAHGGDELRTGRWETLACAPGEWHGRVLLSHDPRLENDGLLALARCAELRAIPTLYGLPPGHVQIVSTQRSTFASKTGSTFQEFLVSWDENDTQRRDLYGAAGASALLVGSLGLSLSLVGAAAGAVVGGAAGAAVAMVVHRRHNDHRHMVSQRRRLLALERGTRLQEMGPTLRPSLDPGSVIAGTYRISSQLGSGANGVIYAATRLSDQLPVAIKLLRAAAAHDEVASDRLRREAEAMGLAWHPNVVELHDQGVLPDGTGYLVMELLKGESLAARLARCQQLTPDFLWPIAVALCDALGAIHAAGVIHRDIKPSNIFLTTDDTGEERVKILDFGIARVEWAETRITMMGATVGTPGYMSPEQARGQEVDARSDLYSLGAVLYECLTGVVPAALIPSLPPSPDLPAAWQSLLARALATQPRDRYADARAFHDALFCAAPPHNDPT